MAAATSGASVAGLSVHPVIDRVLHRDREERARAHMESDEASANAARVDRPQQAVGEVEACRRRGDRALPARVHGLVVIAVPRVGSTADIGRQRHGAVALERRRRAPRRAGRRRGCTSGPSRASTAAENPSAKRITYRPALAAGPAWRTPASGPSEQLPVQRELDPRLAPHARTDAPELRACR